ncbi:Segregation and condensation protein B [compost metagenome]
MNKDLIIEVGRAEAIGRPILYGTTKSFLDYFGLASIKDLPEPGLFEDSENLEEETQLLFNKLDLQQLEPESADLADDLSHIDSEDDNTDSSL